MNCLVGHGLTSTKWLVGQLVGHLLIKEGELAPSEEIEEATTLVPNNSHDDAEPDTTAPTLVPTDHVVDEG